MASKDIFQYKSPNGLVNVNTLSPSKSYFFRLKEPREINKSAFGCQLSFWRLADDRLLYYRGGSQAHEIHSKEEIDLLRKKMENNEFDPSISEQKSLVFVHWSNKGNLAYFIEVDRRQPKEIFDSVILCLKDEYSFRIDELRNNFVLANEMGLTKNFFDEDSVLQRLSLLNYQKFPLYKDTVTNNKLVSAIFPKQKWYPEVPR